MSGISALLTRLCDDAAIFPPGNLPLADAVPAHLGHRRGAHRDMVGPFIVAAAKVEELAHLTRDLPDRDLDIVVTTTLDGVPAALAAVDARAALRLVGLEVSLSDDGPVGDVSPVLRQALGTRTGVTVSVEVPRDERGDDVLCDLAGTPYVAKFRTGGVRYDLYPDEAELAGWVLAAVTAGVAFKATAGLHHAVRNTDPRTGFEQHGFLNLLAATGSALDGADHEEVSTLLADRDAARVAEHVRGLPPKVRDVFRSFGTCSIAEPVEELAALGLLDADITKDLT